MSILASYYSSNAWLPVVSNRGVGHVCSEENHLSNEMFFKKKERKKHDTNLFSSNVHEFVYF